jgi:hypothetical protein
LAYSAIATATASGDTPTRITRETGQMQAHEGQGAQPLDAIAVGTGFGSGNGIEPAPQRGGHSDARRQVCEPLVREVP